MDKVVFMGIEYSLVSDIESFTLLRDEWANLLNNSSICSPFLTWEWLYTWWIEYGQKDPNNTLAIVLGKREGEIVSILPGYIKQEKIGGMRVNAFYFLGSEYESSDYLEIITIDDQNPAHVTEILNWLISSHNIDILRLYNILEYRPILKYLQHLCDERKFEYHVYPHRICPFIPIKGDYESFLQSLSKSMRYNVRRHTRQLFQKFGAEFGWLQTQNEADVENGIKQLFELHERRFRSKNWDTIFQNELRGAFHTKVSKLLSKRGILRLFRLMVEGVPIAMMYSFEYQGELFFFQIGMDPAWEKQSAGQVLIGQVVRYCFDNGLNRFDFMRGGETYKFRWTDKARMIVVVDMGVTSIGKLIVRTEYFTFQIKRFIKTKLLKKEEQY
ncbi:MAG: GNAT family N-acetyltransferase [Calditrichaeota bacterium]|nr:MAG: GNAT family N-acetyltransferase [Calditrichota bacterium]